LLVFLHNMTMNETTDQDWKPQTEGLHQIIQLLRESQSIDNTVQKNVGKVSLLSFFSIGDCIFFLNLININSKLKK
jgi:hypothetical protein